MTRLSLTTRKRKERRQTLILSWWNQVTTIITWFVISLYMFIVKYERNKPRIRYTTAKIDRYSILHRYVYESDHMSISQVRMSQLCFTKLWDLLKTLGGLKASRNMDIDEQVVIFLHIIAHNVKNRVMVCHFYRSGETISRCVSRVCNVVIRLHSYLFKKPEPVPQDSTDHRWKWFKNCLGALERPKYITRKGDIATNVLGVCSPDMQFIFVLPVGYSKERNCVTADDVVWDAYIEKHPDASKWKNKKLPHFEELCVIFGNNRAQGSKARVAYEMEDEINAEEQQMNDEFDEEMEISHNDPRNIAPVEETSTGRSKKRKNMGEGSKALLETFKDAVILFSDSLKESSAQLSEGIKLEVELEKKTTMVISELSNLTSLSQLERFRAIKKIKSDPENVKTFWDLKEEEREAWVKYMLEE